MSPMEVFDRELFKKHVERAIECRVYKNERGGYAKVKARTKRKLVTIKIPLSELDSFLKEVNCQNVVSIE